MKFLEKINKNDSKFVAISYFLLLVTFICLLYFILQTYRWRFHSDAATAGMLALEQIRTHQLLVNGWAYSQDFWPMFVFNSVYFLDGIVDSVFVRTQIWVALQTILIAYLAYTLLGRITGGVVRNICLVYLLSGLSALWSEFFFGQGQYGNVLLFILLATVLVSNILDPKRPVLASGVGLFLVLVYANSTSIRYVPLLILPSVLSLFAIGFSTRELRIRTFISLSILVVSTACGLLFFSILKKNFVFLDGVNVSTLVSYANALSENLPKLLDGLFSLISEEVIGVRLASLSSAFFFLKLGLGLTLIACFFWIFFRKNNSFYAIHSTLYIKYFSFALLCISVISVLFISSISNKVAAARYLMLPVFFMILLSSVVLNDLAALYRRVLLATMIVVSVSNVWTYYIKPYNSVNQFDLVKVELVKRGLVRGFATYWNADVITVLSDYKVKVFHLDSETLKPLFFMSSRKFYETVDNQKTFLLLGKTEVDKHKDFLANHQRGITDSFDFNGFSVFIFGQGFENEFTDWFKPFN